MALAPLAELAQSYFDLRWHFDPVAASWAGIPHYDDRFGRYANEVLRPHVAALKALAAALEELEPDELDDEIDRTALLNDARVEVYRCERERVFSRDPTQWIRRVIDGLSVVKDPASLLGRLGDVAPFLEDAGTALAEPVGLFATTALEQVRVAEAAMRHAASVANAPSDMLRRGLAALAEFQADLMRWTESGPGHFAAGEDHFNFHVHYEHVVRDTAPELWRYGHRLVEEAKGLTGPGRGAERMPDLVVPDQASLTRRILRAPLTVDGWALSADPRPERLLRHAVGVLLDVGLHTRGMTVAEGIALLEEQLDLDHVAAEALVRQTAAAPTYALTAAVGRRELLALRASYSGPDFYVAVRPYGALPVSLMRWGLGLGE